MTEERISPESKDYIELLFHWHRYLSIAKICSGKRVLDIACGEGYGTNYLSNLAQECIGIDISKDVIIKNRKRYPAQFICGSALRIPCKNNIFDVIVSFETIEHLDTYSQEKFLNEIKRILRKDGIFIISTPDRDRTKLFKEKNPYHKKEFTKEEFLNFLGNYFKNVKLYFQEINLMSNIFSGDDESFSQYNIKITDDTSFPINSSHDLHLYLIAVCYEKEILPNLSLSSGCQDIKRTYLEQLWGENNNLKEQIINLEEKNLQLIYKIQRLQNKVELLENEKIQLKHEINKYYNELLKIYNSRGWKILENYYTIMHKIKEAIKR